MQDTGDNIAPIGRRRLSDAIRDIKNANADRGDVVVEMREAERMRLELLANELEPVFAEVPREDLSFDLTISSGLQPRLWIDATAHVDMGRDKRLYRFVRDTRMGRVVLAESHEMKPVADQVTRYIAERLIERERLLNGAPVPIMADGEAGQAASGWRRHLPSWPAAAALVLSGALVGLVFAILLFWDRLPSVHLQY